MHGPDFTCMAWRGTRMPLLRPLGMQVPGHGVARDVGQHDHMPFHRTIEDLYNSVGQYYDLPSLSFRTGLYRLAVHRKEARFR